MAYNTLEERMRARGPQTLEARLAGAHVSAGKVSEAMGIAMTVTPDAAVVQGAWPDRGEVHYPPKDRHAVPRELGRSEPVEYGGLPLGGDQGIGKA